MATEVKYHEGDVVFAKIEPSLKLVIRLYIGGLYYCKVQQDAAREEVVYAENGLMTNIIISHG